MRNGKNPWSRAIDYDKAIAEDLRWIGYYSAIIEKGYFYPADYPDAYHVTLADLVMCGRIPGSDFGLSADAVEEMRQLCDAADVSKTFTLTSGWYTRAEQAYKTILRVYPDSLPREAVARERLKKQRASLASHKRNQAKHGTK